MGFDRYGGVTCCVTMTEHIVLVKIAQVNAVER